MLTSKRVTGKNCFGIATHWWAPSEKQVRMMTADGGDPQSSQCSCSTAAGPTLTHLQRHGSTASDCTTTRSYASSQYSSCSSGYSSGVSGGSVTLYHLPHLGGTMSAIAHASPSLSPDSNKPSFEEVGTLLTPFSFLSEFYRINPEAEC